MAEPAKHVHSDWKSLYRVAGVAALVMVIVFRRNFATELITFSGFGIFDVPAAHPASALEWFALFQRDRLVGLLLYDLVDVINYALLGLIFLAVYMALRETSKSAMLLATSVGFLGVIANLISNQAFAMLNLSNEYAGAGSEAERAAFVGAGEALLAKHNPGALFPGTGGYLSLLFVVLAGLIISVIMLRTDVFGKASAYVGILANGLMLGYFILLPLASGLVAIAFVASAPFRVAWYVLIARRLFQLAKI